MTTVRVASAQLQARNFESADGFYALLGHYVRSAADYGSDFVVFPELFTLMLISGEKQVSGEETVRRLSDHTDRLADELTRLATTFDINVIGGSHLHGSHDAGTRNICHVALRDGSLHLRDKLHPTPSERATWRVAGGSDADIIETDCGPVGVMICYDSEFPEVARHLVDQGAHILFVPYCTDTAHGHLRVRYCCQARTVENQCYVVTAGLCGALINVEDNYINYARSAILTPSDLPFARDGIAAEAEANVEQMIVADLDLDALLQARETGAVRNLKDRRSDLYELRWKRV